MDKRAEERRFKFLLAAVSIIATFAYLTAITFVPIPKENIQFANTILGAMITVVLGTLYNYFYGSSEGSNRKTDMLDKTSDS